MRRRTWSNGVWSMEHGAWNIGKVRYEKKRRERVQDRKQKVGKPKSRVIREFGNSPVWWNQTRKKRQLSRKVESVSPQSMGMLMYEG